MPGLMRMAARTAVVAGTATAVSGNVRRRQDRKYQEKSDAQAYQEQQYAQPQYAPPPQPAYAPPQPAYAPPPAAAPQVDVAAELGKLGQLKQQGLLTDEEFTAAKAKLLGT